MWSDEDLREVIRSAPAAVDDALAAIQRDGGRAPVDLRSFAAAAGLLGSDPVQLCIDHLRSHHLVDPLMEALRARDVRLPGDEPEPDEVAPGGGRLDLVDLNRFTAKAERFRCRIEVDHDFKGTGCLVGPGLVLTAWHVVRRHGPGGPEQPLPDVVVRLEDGSRHDAAMPPAYQSPCGDGEWDQRAPTSDAEVVDRHDVALLSLRTPAARHLGHVPLPESAPAVVSRSPVFLLDFPAGEDGNLGHGTITKLRNVTARLHHDIPTAQGSSGGACFDDRFHLIGVHQAGARISQDGDRVVKRGRFVPLGLFRDEVAELVARDVAPTAIWRLDGDTTQLVIGRDGFASAVAAAAGAAHGAIRGIRIKRRRPAEDGAGLGFSHRILVELLMRQGPEHRVVSVPLDAPSSDLLSDIARWTDAAGIGVAPAPPAEETTGATLEGRASHRARRLAQAIDLAAEEAGRTVWFFVDNPSLPLPEARRLELEAFVAECLPLPRIRLVIAGLETVPLGGLEFSSPAAADPAGPAGLVVEYIGGFTRADILDCLTLATTDLVGDAVPRDIELVLNVLLVDFTPFNGMYSDADLPAIVETLQRYFRTLGTGGDADGERRADPAA
jgi:hypothetical protein